MRNEQLRMQEINWRIPLRWHAGMDLEELLLDATAIYHEPDALLNGDAVWTFWG